MKISKEKFMIMAYSLGIKKSDFSELTPEEKIMVSNYLKDSSLSIASSDEEKDTKNFEYYEKYKNAHKRMMQKLESLKNRLSYFSDPSKYDSDYDYKEEYEDVTEIAKKLQEV